MNLIPESVGIISKRDAPRESVKKVLEFLTNKVDIFADSTILGFDEVKCVSVDEMDVDLLICMGGDGTILRALHSVKRVPILGIAAGVVSFLADVSIEDAIPSLEKVLRGFEIEKRSRLHVTIDEESLANAMNEVSINTTMPAKMIHFRVLINGSELETVRADGVIFATPTGSTAYAMSAGGPIVDPKVDACIIVPLAPFKLSARPIVVPMDCKLRLELLENDATVVVDGQIKANIKKGNTITITKSDDDALFVRTGHTFFSKVKGKLD